MSSFREPPLPAGPVNSEIPNPAKFFEEEKKMRDKLFNEADLVILESMARGKNSVGASRNLQRHCDCKGQGGHEHCLMEFCPLHPLPYTQKQNNWFENLKLETDILLHRIRRDLARDRYELAEGSRSRPMGRPLSLENKVRIEP